MKKLLSILAVIVFSLSLFGCAEIEYVFSQNFDDSISLEFNIYLDEDYLKRYGYKVDQMKEFLFEFFGLYGDKKLNYNEKNSDSVIFYNKDESIKYTLKFDRGTNIVSYVILFKDLATYEEYYGGSEEEPYEIEKGFFYYKIIQKIDSPFLIVKQKWIELYNNPLDTSYFTIDFAQVFMWGLKDISGNTIFEGFRTRFPNIPQDEIEKLLYRFVLSYARGKMQNTAHKKQVSGLNTYLIWEFNDQTVGEQITLITIKPNAVGWNVLALGLTAVFGGIIALIAFSGKKKESLKPAAIPPAAYFTQQDQDNNDPV
ncbi:MAG TPA: hypothetical protein VIL23_06110 [Clostridia bacterium]